MIVKPSTSMTSPSTIFLWAEVQHCVNAYDSDLFLKVQRGEAEIVDEKGDRIGWGGFAGDGQHIYVRLLNSEAPQTMKSNPCRQRD